MNVELLHPGQAVGIRRINALGDSRFGCRGTVVRIDPAIKAALVRYAQTNEERWVNGIRLYVPEESATCQKK
jgi:hypothetical protein